MLLPASYVMRKLVLAFFRSPPPFLVPLAAQISPPQNPAAGNPQHALAEPVAPHLIFNTFLVAGRFLKP
jgi:hypothetical protein